ncbi:MAG: 16S rRNA (uracil(1498)-N(3))-methyltransferase [Microbacteriaceae bacterium]
MAHFFLVPEFSGSTAPGSEIIIVGEEARHAVTVSRVRPGETLAVGDGAGTVVSGTVRRVSAAELVLEVQRIDIAPAPTTRLILAQALAKGGRDELAIQAATELGVDGVIPWAAGRSVSRWRGAKVDRGRQRWERVVREATKQSIRPWLPEVAALADTSRLVALAGRHRMLVLEPTASRRLRQTEPDDRDTILVVGPEGGITPEELKLLASAGADPVRLGDTILRTSTAGPAAVAVLNSLLKRW